MMKRISMRLLGGALTCSMIAAPALAQLAVGQTVTASPTAVDAPNAWQTCTVASATDTYGWTTLACNGAPYNVHSQWIRAAQPMAGPTLPGQLQAQIQSQPGGYAQGAYPAAAPAPQAYAAPQTQAGAYPAGQGGYAQPAQPGGYAQPAAPAGYGQGGYAAPAAGAYPTQQGGYAQAPQAVAYPAPAPQQAGYNPAPAQAPAANNPFAALATALGSASGAPAAGGDSSAVNAIAGAIGAFSALANASRSGQAAQAPAAQAAPAQYPAQAQQVAMQAAAPAGAMPGGAYACSANGQPAPVLNFTVTGPGQYQAASDGTMGTFQHNPANGAVTFTGVLGNAQANGFNGVYHANSGVPTLSFRDATGAEAAFCQRA